MRLWSPAATVSCSQIISNTNPPTLQCAKRAWWEGPGKGGEGGKATAGEYTPQALEMANLVEVPDDLHLVVFLTAVHRTTSRRDDPLLLGEETLSVAGSASMEGHVQSQAALQMT